MVSFYREKGFQSILSRRKSPLEQHFVREYLFEKDSLEVPIKSKGP